VYAEAVKMPVDTAQDTKTVTVRIIANNLPAVFFYIFHMYFSSQAIEAKCTKKFDFL